MQYTSYQLSGGGTLTSDTSLFDCVQRCLVDSECVGADWNSAASACYLYDNAVQMQLRIHSNDYLQITKPTDCL